MNREQILALAEEQGAVANLKQHFNMAGDSIVFTPEELEAFLNAAIESYKAELLKEVGEPVAELTEIGINWLYDGLYLPVGTKLYTTPPQPDDVRDAERYRWLRDSENQVTEDDPCVSDSFFNSWFGEELDKVIDEMIARNAAIAAAKGEV